LCRSVLSFFKKFLKVTQTFQLYWVKSALVTSLLVNFQQQLSQQPHNELLEINKAAETSFVLNQAQVESLFSTERNYTGTLVVPVLQHFVPVVGAGGVHGSTYY